MTASLADLGDVHRRLLGLETPAVISSVNPDGSLLTTPVWFLVDDDEPRFSSVYSSRRVRNLIRRPQCGFLVLDPENSNRYLELRGQARVDDDSDYRFADRIGAKYGADLRSWDAPDARRAAVTIKVETVKAVDAS